MRRHRSKYQLPMASREGKSVAWTELVKPVPKTFSIARPDRRVSFSRQVSSSGKNRLYCPAEGLAAELVRQGCYRLPDLRLCQQEVGSSNTMTLASTRTSSSSKTSLVRLCMAASLTMMPPTLG